MRFCLVKGTKPANADFQPLFDHYTQRIKGLAPLETRVLKFTERPFDVETLKKERDRLGHGVHCILLDERGVTFDSVGLAKRVQSLLDEPSVKHLLLVSGGPYGFSDEARTSADECWSLSRLTMQGDLAWLTALEQLYRSLTILKGIPYHHA